MKLQIGMRVEIKNDESNYGDEAGKVKTITKHLPDYQNNRAFQLDNDTSSIWIIEDFEKNVDYPHLPMQ